MLAVADNQSKRGFFGVSLCKNHRRSKREEDFRRHQIKYIQLSMRVFPIRPKEE